MRGQTRAVQVGRVRATFRTRGGFRHQESVRCCPMGVVLSRGRGVEGIMECVVSGRVAITRDETPCCGERKRERC